jgi:hypothetical protein
MQPGEYVAWKHWLSYAPSSLFIFLLFEGKESLVQACLENLWSLQDITLKSRSGVELPFKS